MIVLLSLEGMIILWIIGGLTHELTIGIKYKSVPNSKRTTHSIIKNPLSFIMQVKLSKIVTYLCQDRLYYHLRET